MARRKVDTSKREQELPKPDPESDEIIVGRLDTEPEDTPEPETDPRLPTIPEQRRTTAYSSRIMERILLMIADGKTLREIAKEPGMPTKSTVQRWIMKYPDLAQAWKAARELSASSLEEEALDMARVLKRQTDFNGTQVRAYDVAMAQFRWSASHRDPAQFGQTSQPTITVPVQINTSLDLGQAGGSEASQKAIAASQTTYEIAAKVNQEYNAQHAEIEGTDYTVDTSGLGAETPVVESAPDAGAPEPEPDDDGLSIVPDIDPKRDALSLKRSTNKGGRPRKGHMPAHRVKMKLTRAKFKALKSLKKEDE